MVYMTETFITRVIGGGRITIAKDVRIREKLVEGDYVKVVITRLKPEDVEVSMEELFNRAKRRAEIAEREKIMRKHKGV